MKSPKQKNTKNFIVIIIITTFVIMSIPSFCFSTTALAGPCEEALTDCLIDAVIIGVLSGGKPGLLYAAWCAAGYIWCKEYYE